MDYDDIFGGVGHGPRNNQSDVGVDPDHEPNPGILEKVLLNTWNSYTSLLLARCQHAVNVTSQRRFMFF